MTLTAAIPSDRRQLRNIPFNAAPTALDAECCNDSGGEGEKRPREGRSKKQPARSRDHRPVANSAILLTTVLGAERIGYELS
jgi:hypothetical protein